MLGRQQLDSEESQGQDRQCIVMGPLDMQGPGNAYGNFGEGLFEEFTNHHHTVGGDY